MKTEEINRTSVWLGDAWSISRSYQVEMTAHSSSWISKYQNPLLFSPFHY